MHRDAVALQFAAHVETGPRKQDCPPVLASGALTTLRRSEDAGVSGERGAKKHAFNTSSVKGEEFWALAFFTKFGRLSQ